MLLECGASADVTGAVTPSIANTAIAATTALFMCRFPPRSAFEAPRQAQHLVNVCLAVKLLRLGVLGWLVAAALTAGFVAMTPAAGACAGPCAVADYDGDGVNDWADNCPL